MSADLRALTAEEVAAIFGLTGTDYLRQLRRAVNRGAIPKPLPRVGRAPVWSPVAIERWMATNGNRTSLTFGRTA